MHHVYNFYSLNEYFTVPGPRTEEPESWINREPTLEETQAVTKLQAGWKGCYVRKIKQASKPGLFLFSNLLIIVTFTFKIHFERIAYGSLPLYH